VPRNSIPVSPGLAPALDRLPAGPTAGALPRRTIWLSAVAVAIAILATIAARVLLLLIDLLTNLAWHGRWSFAPASPWDHTLGLWGVLIPVGGGLVVGLMARYGSAAIRGHGIPEAMEQVLKHESRIPARMTVLKPLSAAIAIGTGGPFGAEGPIIATGGALGSLLGQALHITADERKTLLAAGAAAGMSAIFGSPIAAVLLAIELLLFEYRARSLVPVTLAASVAATARHAWGGAGVIFPMLGVAAPDLTGLALYAMVGALVGGVAVLITRMLYLVEEGFERLPISWPWWPAIGGVAVGLIGLWVPRTLGVGYGNLEAELAGTLTGTALAVLVGAKLVSWLIALGSGTSGGTLAPLFTVGGGLGALLGGALLAWDPGASVDPRIAALVGMAAIFAGASRALLTSAVFAFEITGNPDTFLPLMVGCAAAYLVSLLQMEHTIMTEKLVRRGTRVPHEYSADWLEQVTAGEIATTEVVALRSVMTIAEAREMITGDTAPRHQGYPVLDESGGLIGVITRGDLLASGMEEEALIAEALRRPSVTVPETASARAAADLMVQEGIGRLPVLSADGTGRLVGILTRSDLLMAHDRRLRSARRTRRGFRGAGG
jgi:CIC family chloride channel protein